MMFGGNRGRLYDAQKTARARWDVAQETWSDEAQVRFAETVWQPLDQLTSDALRAADLLAVLFTQVRTDCEFDPSF